MVVPRPAACQTIRRPLGSKGRLMCVAYRILFFTISTQKFTDWPWINLIFICPYTVIRSCSTTNKMHLLSHIIHSCKTLYMFWTVFPSIIRSSRLCIQRQVYIKQLLLDCVWNVMAHAQKPDFVFQRIGRVHLNRRGRHYWQLRFVH